MDNRVGLNLREASWFISAIRVICAHKEAMEDLDLSCANDGPSEYCLFPCTAEA